MQEKQKFSNVTKAYLCRFYEILDQMVAKMTCLDLTSSLSFNFIVQMIPHHQAAIEMSQNLLQYTTFVPLQEIALEIIEKQSSGIRDMQRILGHCASLTNSPRDLCLYQRNFHQIAQTMFQQMQMAPTKNDINADYMREMIPHHQGAIRMSKNIMHYSICADLLPILQSIISSQQKGISKMERLLRCI